MFRFKSSLTPVELKRKYLKKYKMKSLQQNFEKLLIDYPEIKNALPDGCDARKLLIGDFKYLVKVYIAFTGVIAGKDAATGKAIRDAFIRRGFNYENHKEIIRKFLTDTTNGFEIYNCVYCDLEDVTTFTKADGTKVRKFETEHVLDKGECPLVSLSLYNFVPSCGTCNGPAIKGTKTIGDTEDEIARLSPSADGYNFEGKVRFGVKLINPNAADLRATTHLMDYEVDFEVKEAIYQKTINLFELKSRYNVDKYKAELLKWREKRRSNPDNIVQQFADIKHVTFNEMFEEMFELELRKRAHSTMEKARRDIMML